MEPATLPECLGNWIDCKIPDLGGVACVRFFLCDRLPFERFYGGEKYSGLTLWNRVYIRSTHAPIDAANLDSVELILHELGHVLQFQDQPLLCPLRYLYYTARYGYWNNPMELSVRSQTDVLIRDYRNEAPWKL